jgi:hypothetical protein
MDSYYCHVGARVLAAVTGTVPKKWYAALVEVAERNRASDGSIQPVGVWGQDGGKPMTTGFLVLAVAAPWAEPIPDSTAPKASDFFRRKSRSVSMPATATLWPTGIYVEPGVKIEYVPGGTVVSYPGIEPVGPDGHRRTPHDRDRVTTSGPYGCLLGQVGPDGKPFSMKRKGRLRIRERGQLYLRTNDEDPSRARGGFTVDFTLD